MSVDRESASRHPLLSMNETALRRRTSVKWREYDSTVIPLWVAEMDVALAPPVVDAITRAADEGDTGYAWGRPYCDAARDYAAQQWGVHLAPEQAQVAGSVVAAMTEVIRATPGSGEVILSAPVYGPFEHAAREAGRALRIVGLGPDHRLDLGALDEAFAQSARVQQGNIYLLCNPHNPTGVVPTHDELSRLAELADQHGVKVVSDEIHSPLCLPGSAHTSYLKVAPDSDAVVLFSASKAWNISAAKAAVVFAGASGTEHLRRLPVSLAHSASHLGVIAHTAALRDGESWMRALRGDLLVARDHAMNQINTQLPEVRVSVPNASFLLWLDCRELALGTTPAQYFLEKSGVALSSGEEFVAGGEGFARLNYAAPLALLDQAVERMARALARDRLPRQH